MAANVFEQLFQRSQSEITNAMASFSAFYEPSSPSLPPSFTLKSLTMVVPHHKPILFPIPRTLIPEWNLSDGDKVKGGDVVSRQEPGDRGIGDDVVS